MSAFVLLLASFGLLAAPGIARDLMTVKPRTAVILGSGSLLFGILGVDIALWFLAAPTATAWLHLDALACWSPDHRLIFDGVPFGWVPLLLATSIAIAVPALWLVRRSRASRSGVEVFLGTHHDMDGVDLVILPTPRLLAYAVSERDPMQVVVSQGLVTMLEPDELRAVVGHEVAHLRLGHQWSRRLGSITRHFFGWLPLVQRSTAALSAAIELSADAEASRSTKPDTIKRAIRKATPDRSELHPGAQTELSLRLGAHARPRRRVVSSLARSTIVYSVPFFSASVAFGSWLTDPVHLRVLTGGC
jgi:Zn-dependent protease with chaperone function